MNGHNLNEYQTQAIKGQIDSNKGYSYNSDIQSCVQRVALFVYLTF